ncbi:hypothetical protein [Pedobacter sp. SYSU D00535]|uniref:hypothetical protein n=1 Tax=Pedobacter sp. SYSU D00535 TaxID=2810308 RepID=UPI001A961315|nr:hypothetical protein [Pedobacter sp. SYSU D00535]
MDSIAILRALGEETIKIESLFLELKIEKALKGVDFCRQAPLTEAENLWQLANAEYYSFLDFLQREKGVAA